VQLDELILYNRHGAQRRIAFEPGRLNIITGFADRQIESNRYDSLLLAMDRRTLRRSNSTLDLPGRTARPRRRHRFFVADPTSTKRAEPL